MTPDENELMFKDTDFLEFRNRSAKFLQSDYESIAQIANALLKQRIEKLEKVYMEKNCGSGWHACDWSECKHSHEARLLGKRKLET